MSCNVITVFFLGVMNLLTQGASEVSYTGNTKKPLDSQKRMLSFYEQH